MHIFPTERPAQEEPRLRDPREAGVPAAGGGGPLRASAVQTCLAELSMEIEGDFSACENVGREGPPGAAPQNEDQIPGALTKPGHDTHGADFADHKRLFDEDLQAAVDFFKLPPPLLSPVPSPPLGSAPPLGTLPSALALVSLHFDFESPGGYSGHPSMLVKLSEHSWYSDQTLSGSAERS